MRTSLLCLLVAGLAGAPVAAAAEPAAVVASVTGRVEVVSARGGAARPAAFGRPLERGDRVTTGKGGGATLLLADGSVVTLAERASITLGGTAAPARAAAVPGEVFAHVSQFATAGSRQTGLVTLADMRSDADAGAPLLLSPRNTTVLEDAPTLRWRAVQGATRYRVRMVAAAGAEAWARDVAAEAHAEPSLAYPADAPRLEPGATYEWEVVALDEKGTLLAEGAGGEQAAAARFLAGSYLAGLELYDEAARQFEALASLAPGTPEPHEALGNLYLKVGASDRAAAEFRLALSLQRNAR